MVKIGSRQFVRSMPTELSTDSNTLIELAQVGAEGWSWVAAWWGTQVHNGSAPLLISALTLTCPTHCIVIPSPQRLGGYFALADAVASTGWQEERVGGALHFIWGSCARFVPYLRLACKHAGNTHRKRPVDGRSAHSWPTLH